MANTKVLSTLAGSGKDRLIVRHLHLVSDGTNETDYVMYDPASFGLNVNTGVLKAVKAGGKATGVCRLEWDATTDVPIVSFSPSYALDLEFSPIQGHPNPNTSGATGKIQLTTIGLASGDEFFITLYILQQPAAQS